jgi:predicted TIM-barrel fold metal-dependent hydrolase
MPSQTSPAQGEQRRRIVDAQIHLWKAETSDRPWVAGRPPQMPEPFTIEKIVPMMDEAGVDRVVIVPPSWPGDRNDYALEAVQRYPGRFAVMGRIPLQDPKSAELLPTWKEQPGMLGVRVTLHGALAPWLTDGTADWFWPAAEKASLPVTFLTPGQSPAMGRIAERHPGLTLIIDHMALSLDIARDGKVGEAIEQTVALAKYPNVSCKVSSSPTYSRDNYQFADMKPHLKRVFEAFGPQRCYWGTDITHAFGKSTYRQRITHFTETLDFLSEEDKDWVMGRAIEQRLGWAPN